RPRRRSVPPQTPKTDLADGGADALNGRQQLRVQLAPTPPVMADVRNVKPLGRGMIRFQLRSRIVAVKKQRRYIRLERRGGGLQNLASEQLETGPPPVAAPVMGMITVVPVDRNPAVVHAVRVQDGSPFTRQRRQQAREPQAAHPSEFRLDDEDRVIERADLA